MRLRFALGLLLPVCPLGAQQFVHQTGAIPGTARWSEGVEAADIENDGDLDLFFADGDGFTTPGTKRQNVLIVNRLDLAPLTFEDQSLARLGSHESNAKMVITGDIQDDGFIDALFCNAFNTDLPFLYVNDASTPGFFTFEGAARGFTTVYSSGSGMFGDVDDDGDLDVLLNDAYLGSATGKPHLYRNDGAGFFTEDLAFQAAAPAKSAQMDVQLVDLEGDLDLDFIGMCRAENGSASAGDHYLMVNDGTGSFTDMSEVLPDANPNGVYEAEIGDLDGDSDLDVFLVSLSGFADGPFRGTFVPNGTLGYQAAPAQGGDDDNEVALFDFDDDGDLDPVIGSLGFGGEKIFVNNAGFTIDSTSIQSISDSTLDLTVCDLDNDGAYDIVTAQGESNPGQWANKVYRNIGTGDTRAPLITHESSLAATGIVGTWTVRAAVRDAVLDDGRNWVSAAVRYVVLDTPLAGSVDITSGGFSVSTLTTDVGTVVTWTNQDTVAHSVTSTTPGYGFDSGSLLPAQSYQVVFVTEGTYDYEDTVGGLAPGQVVVSGTATTGVARYSGGSLYRFTMTDTSGGSGVQLAYELQFTDWAGNFSASRAKIVPLGSTSARNGGTNPLSYTSGPAVLGTTLNATVDLGGTTGHSLALLFGFDGPAALTLSGGQTLLCLDLGSSGELLGTVSEAGPLASFSLPIPADTMFLGFVAYTQAIHFGGVVPFALSNAQDWTVGF